MSWLLPENILQRVVTIWIIGNVLGGVVTSILTQRAEYIFYYFVLMAISMFVMFLITLVDVTRSYRLTWALSWLVPRSTVVKLIDLSGDVRYSIAGVRDGEHYCYLNYLFKTRDKVKIKLLSNTLTQLDSGAYVGFWIPTNKSQLVEYQLTHDLPSFDNILKMPKPEMICALYVEFDIKRGTT